MKSSLFTWIIVLCTFGCAAHAQSAALVAPVAGAALGAFLSKDRSEGTQVAAAAGGALAGWIGGKMIEDKNAKERFKMYQLGRYHEAWVRAQTDWYYSTNDRKTGLPVAFDGYWAMFIGLPNIEKDVAAKRAQLPAQFVPAEREAFIEYLNAQGSAPASANPTQNNGGTEVLQVPTTKAIMPARTVNGIDYRPAARQFPRLP